MTNNIGDDGKKNKGLRPLSKINGAVYNLEVAQKEVERIKGIMRQLQFKSERAAAKGDVDALDAIVEEMRERSDQLTKAEETFSAYCSQYGLVPKKEE